jgi:hypothetical protein
LEPSVVTSRPKAQTPGVAKLAPPGMRSHAPVLPQLKPAGQQRPFWQMLPPRGHWRATPPRSWHAPPAVEG